MALIRCGRCGTTVVVTSATDAGTFAIHWDTNSLVICRERQDKARAGTLEGSMECSELDAAIDEAMRQGCL
jgi:hypothetical protein